MLYQYNIIKGTHNVSRETLSIISINSIAPDNNYTVSRYIMSQINKHHNHAVKYVTMHTFKGKTGYGNSHSIVKCKCFTWNICIANSEKIVQVYSKISICTHIFIGKICTIASFQLSNICSTKPNWEVYAVRSINYS